MKKSKLKSKLVWIYEYIYELKRVLILRTKYRLRIMSPIKTIKYIKKHNCSIARYGDGEFNIMFSYNNPHFQSITPELSKRLIQTLRNDNSNLLLCVPIFLNSTQNANTRAKDFWITWGKSQNGLFHKNVVQCIRKNAGKKYIFGDTQITRPYMDWKNDKRAKRTFPLLKSLWDKKNIIIVEGEQTRLGVGNDLFDCCGSIKRILAPAYNAFDYYNEIKQSILKYHNDEIIILALGPTATVLAAELSDLNIQALDIGHIDLEYEWFLRGAKEKIAIEGKFVNENANGRVYSVCNDENYIAQIIERIGCKGSQ